MEVTADLGENFSWSWFSYDLLAHSYEYERPIFVYLAFFLPFILIGIALIRIFFSPNKQLDLMPKEYQFSWWMLWGAVPWFFFLGSIALICLSLSRPQKPNEIKKNQVEGIDIVLVLDISGSMVSGTDISPNRLEKTKELAAKFVSKRDNDNIGVILFSGQAIVKAPLTQDQAMLQELIEGISPEEIAVGGTAIGNGCALGVSLIKNTQSKSKIMILLSDGSDQGGDITPIDAAKLAETYGIKIYSIGVGGGQSGGLFGSVFGMDINFQELEDMAKTTNGKFFKATNNNALETIFNEIDTLETIKIEEEKYKFKSDYYHIYLFWAILFLAIFVVLRSTFMVGMHRE